MREEERTSSMRGEELEEEVLHTYLAIAQCSCSPETHETHPPDSSVHIAQAPGIKKHKRAPAAARRERELTEDVGPPDIQAGFRLTPLTHR